ncbi:MAG: 4-(cytidine 5'-diphospho)-2-C-methyl-D-erythritol kinase [Burkholderiales bacterium]|nr:4-(cytidine 5'-diphospho)-2-C-methyl-D-erythritol kinase [Burkholderiales bacterium]
MRLPGPDYPAPAKLNLFLHIVGRLPDGYHLLQSVFTPIDLCDLIRVQVREDGRIERVNEVAGVAADDDLVVRAARLLKEATGTRLGASIELDKRIPMGGGLGGGSSDAATVLKVLNRLWKAGFDDEALGEIGLSLGADVPFFVQGSPAWAEGIGDRLRPIDLPPAWYLVLVPPVSVPTPAIYAAPELTRNTEALKMEDFSARPPDFLKDPRFHNDMEAVVVARYPEVREGLAWLAKRASARMTGSGGCVFAAFASRGAAQQVLEELPATMKGFVARGLEHHPLREVSSSP